MGPVDLDPDGGTQLVIDDKYVIDIEPAEGTGLELLAAVGPAPAAGRETAFAELLAANLLGQATGRARLALDADLDEIVLCRRLEGGDELTLAAFEEALGEFVAVLEIWQERLARNELGSSMGGQDQHRGPDAAGPERTIIRG
jgi:hypothetical protein